MFSVTSSDESRLHGRLHSASNLTLLSKRVALPRSATFVCAAGNAIDGSTAVTYRGFIRHATPFTSHESKRGKCFERVTQALNGAVTSESGSFKACDQTKRRTILAMHTHRPARHVSPHGGVLQKPHRFGRQFARRMTRADRTADRVPAFAPARTDSSVNQNPSPSSMRRTGRRSRPLLRAVTRPMARALLNDCGMRPDAFVRQRTNGARSTKPCGSATRASAAEDKRSACRTCRRGQLKYALSTRRGPAPMPRTGS